MYQQHDLHHSPLVAFYELTRACDLACRHCRAHAIPERDPAELATEEAGRLMDQFAAFPQPPIVVLTGGDPLKRPDLFEVIEHGARLGLEVSITPAVTPLLTDDTVRALKDAGIRRLAVSIDGPDAQTHDGFRRAPGSFDRSLEVIDLAREAGLDVQVNTTITARNAAMVDAMAERLAGRDIVIWSVFFLVPVGRGRLEERVAAEECEAVFERLWYQALRRPFGIKTTEAPHYRRFVFQKIRQLCGEKGQYLWPARRAPVAVNDGKGILFVSHTGDIYPSGFLPIRCGLFPRDSVVEVYQNSAVFRLLRNPDRLDGKCGRCEFRSICGGSRARAYAVTGDLLAEEPDCAYVPAGDGRRAVAR